MIKIENLTKSINSIVDLKNPKLDSKYSSQDLLLDLLTVYMFYLENIDDSNYTKNNSDGTLLYDDIIGNVKNNLLTMTEGEDKSTFGNVTLLPEDDICDLIISLESCLHVQKNVGNTIFVEEFLYQIKHNSHQYLVNAISFFSQMESIHN